MRNLYIHVPFCAGKCDYCAFYSEPVPDADMIRLWLDRILRELEENAPRLVHAETVYFGGGTPSLLPGNILQRLFAAVEGDDLRVIVCSAFSLFSRSPSLKYLR